MRFKSMLKKSSAVMASLVIFCSALPCRAMVPFGSGDDRGYILDAPRFERDVVCPDIPDEARLEHMIESETNRCNRLLSGRFRVSKAVRERIHPYFLYMFVRNIGDIFAAHPGITSMFVQQMKQFGEYNFTIG